MYESSFINKKGEGRAENPKIPTKKGRQRKGRAVGLSRPVRFSLGLAHSVLSLAAAAMRHQGTRKRGRKKPQ